MQPGDKCDWFLIKLPDNTFAMQYSGKDPDKVFPVNSSGLALLYLN